jgi:hypothetical protein
MRTLERIGDYRIRLIEKEDRRWLSCRTFYTIDLIHTYQDHPIKSVEFERTKDINRDSDQVIAVMHELEKHVPPEDIILQLSPPVPSQKSKSVVRDRFEGIDI